MSSALVRVCACVLAILVSPVGRAACIVSALAPVSGATTTVRPTFTFIQTTDCATSSFSLTGTTTRRTPTFVRMVSGRRQMQYRPTAAEWSSWTSSSSVESLAWTITAADAAGTRTFRSATLELDLDADASSRSLGDCDDTDAAINPAAIESCYGAVDEDCDWDAGCDVPPVAYSWIAAPPVDTDGDGDFDTDDQTRILQSDIMSRVASCDVDGDGTQDLVVGPGLVPVGTFVDGDWSSALPDHSTWAVFLGPIDAPVDFSSADATVETPPPGGYSSLIACGDVTGDSRADVIIANPSFDGYHGRAWIFDAPISGSYTDGDAIATIDGEISSVDYTSPAGDLSTCFSRHDEGAMWLGYSVLAPGDLDGDGIGDLVIGAAGYFDAYVVDTVTLRDGTTCNAERETGGAEFVFLGPVSGSLTQVDATTTFTDTSWNPARPAGDVDGDGDIDLVLRGALRGEYDVPTVMAVVDGDEGGIVPVAYDAESSSAVATYEWGNSTSTDFDEMYDVAAGDFDGDGSQDLVLVFGEYGTPAAAYIVDGPVAGKLSVSAEITYTVEYAGALFCRNAGDVTGDGVDDLLVGAADAIGQMIFSGPFAATVETDEAVAAFTGFKNTPALAIGDNDGDGSDDLVFSDTLNSTAVYLVSLD